MAGPLPPEEDEFDEFDELDVEELEEAAGGFMPPLEDTNSSCTINGNCGCTAS